MSKAPPSSTPRFLKRWPASHFFSPTPGTAADLGRQGARGGVISVLAQIVRFISQLVATSILAHLLAPQDFGYVAMATIVVTVGKMFAGQALTTGIIQEREIGEAQVSGFFWISAGVSLGLTVAALALAPGVAWFFEEPLLIGIGCLLALQILFSGLASSHQALLTRSMNFGLLSALDLTAGLLSKVIGIVAAFQGAGYWALVIIPVAQDGIKAALVWYYCGWRPQLARVPRASGRLLRFGAKMSLTSIVGNVASQLDGVLIGKVWDSAALGLYNKSLTLVQLPLRLISWPLETIAVSTLSKLQDDRQRYKTFFLATAENFLFFVTPGIAILYMDAANVVILLLGDQWHAAIPVFRWLALLILAQCVVFPVDWFLVSTARLKKYFTLALMGNVTRIAAIVLGLGGGPVGVAQAMLIAMLVFLPVQVWYAFRHTHIGMLEYFRTGWRVTAAIGISLGLSWLARAFWFGHLESRLLALFSIAVFTGGSYLLAIYLLPGGKTAILTAIGTLRDMLKRRSASQE